MVIFIGDFLGSNFHHQRRQSINVTERKTKTRMVGGVFNAGLQVKLIPNPRLRVGVRAGIRA
jgi:hypothetical protein